MKQLLLLACAILFSIQSYAQETSLGVTAGYLNINASSSAGIHSGSRNASGFFVGILADMAFSESFYIQSAVNYGNAENSNLILIPVLAKYYVAGSSYNLVAGPQVSIIPDELPGNIKSVGLDLGFGAGYDITEHFFLQARYFLELTNRADNNIMGFPQDVEIRYNVNTLFAGLGYKF